MNNKIKIDVLDNTLHVEHEDGRFVEGKARLSYGKKKLVTNLNRPSKMRYKGDDDIIMDMPEYDEGTDQDIYVLSNMLTGWSKEDKITRKNILEDDILGDLFDVFVEEVKKMNGMVKDKEKKSKKSDTLD